MFSNKTRTLAQNTGIAALTLCLFSGCGRQQEGVLAREVGADFENAGIRLTLKDDGEYRTVSQIEVSKPNVYSFEFGYYDAGSETDSWGSEHSLVPPASPSQSHPFNAKVSGYDLQDAKHCTKVRLVWAGADGKVHTETRQLDDVYVKYAPLPAPARHK